MKIQYLSDLHLEYFKENTDIFNFVKPEGDILVLAGDISSFYNLHQIHIFLKQLSKHFKALLYIPGNHEYYFPKRKSRFQRRNKSFLYNYILYLEKKISNLYFLDKGSICIDDICIAGCTLWTHCSLEYLPSYIRIHEIDKKQYNKMHQDSLQFLYNIDQYCHEHKKKLIIVTHHCPLKTPDQDLSNHCIYYANLDFNKFKKVKYWIYGHTHKNQEVKINNIHITCNQYGKKQDIAKSTFSKTKYITI